MAIAFSALADASRVTGTASVVDGSLIRLTLTQGAADLVWNNAQLTDTWDLNTTANFSNGAANDVFLAADAVAFNDMAPAGDKTIFVAGNRAPSQITVNNSAGNYTFGAFGALIGAGSLVKSGTSTLTLGADLTYGMTGGITINDGTINLGNKTIGIGGALTVNRGTVAAGTVNASRFYAQAGTVSATLTGAGPLTKTGSGTTILSANNSYSGITTVIGGTLQIGSKGTTGSSGTGPIGIDTGATVRFDRSNNFGNIGNAISGTGTLVFDGVTTSNATQYGLTGDNSGFFGTITALDGRVGATNAAGNRFCGAELVAVGKAVSSGQFWLTGGTFSNNFTIPNNANAVDLTVNQGGMVRVVSGTSAASNIASHAHFRGVTLNGAVMELGYSGTGTYYNNESFALGTGGLTVGGTTPSSVILGIGTAAETGIALTGSRSFTVADVTGSPAVDFLVAAELENSDSNNGELVKAGAGTMQIAADTSYTGFTNIGEGTLLVSASLNGTTGVEVAAAATLGGLGRIAPGGGGAINVQAGGNIAPGIGLGTLTIDGLNSAAGSVLSLAPDARFVFELGSALQSDRIALTNAGFGDIAFGGNTINVSDLTNGALAQGAYTLFAADLDGANTGLITDANGFVSQGLAIGSGLELYRGSALQVVGNDIVLNVIPEPASAATLGAGVAMLLGLRRRRK